MLKLHFYIITLYIDKFRQILSLFFFFSFFFFFFFLVLPDPIIYVNFIIFLGKTKVIMPNFFNYHTNPTLLNISLPAQPLTMPTSDKHCHPTMTGQTKSWSRTWINLNSL